MIAEQYIEYGILAEPANYTNENNHWEMGWLFTVGAENIKIGGLRVKFPMAQNTTAHLWDYTGNLLASVEIVAVAADWVTGFFDGSIELAAGESYVISCYNPSNRYYSGSGNFTFNDKIRYGGGRYIANQNAFPTNVESNTVYPMIDIVIDTTPPYDSKYLIRSNSTLYTITDGTLTALAETEITASLFQTYGVDEIPDGALLVGLTDPEVLYWQDSTDELPNLTLTVKGTPPLPQMFTSNPMDLTHESIAGISHAAVDASEDVRFAISFDGGTTWKAFDGSAWFDTSDTVPGMLASTMNAITAEQWAEVVVLDSYMVRFWLPNVTAYVKSVVMHYINP